MQASKSSVNHQVESECIKHLNNEATKKQKKDENLISSSNKKPAIFINLNRTPEIQAARLKLPILAEEQQVVETINDNSVIIITGETGSGA